MQLVLEYVWPNQASGPPGEAGPRPVADGLQRALTASAAAPGPTCEGGGSITSSDGAERRPGADAAQATPTACGAVRPPPRTR